MISVVVREKKVVLIRSNFFDTKYSLRNVQWKPVRKNRHNLSKISNKNNANKTPDYNNDNISNIRT